MSIVELWVCFFVIFYGVYWLAYLVTLSALEERDRRKIEKENHEQ